MGTAERILVTCSASSGYMADRRLVSVRLCLLGTIAWVCFLVPALPTVTSAQTSTPPALVEFRIGVISAVGKPAGKLLVRYSWQSEIVSKRVDGAGDALYVPTGTMVHLSERTNSRCRCVFHWTLQISGNQSRRKFLTKPTITLRITEPQQVAAVFVPVSGDIALVPSRQDAVLAPLPAGQVRVPAIRALQAAEKVWGLSDSDIDLKAGIVRAVVGIEGDAVHHDVKAWLVIADREMPNFAPGSTITYHKIVVVVSAVTGRVAFSYPTESTSP